MALLAMQEPDHQAAAQQCREFPERGPRTAYHGCAGDTTFRFWPKGAVVKSKKKTKAEAKTESSSAFFERLRPKFLDWRPPTEEEKALEVKARRDAKEAELNRVLELAKARELEKAGKSKKRRRSGGARSKPKSG